MNLANSPGNSVTSHQLHAIVVGGSLSGLCATLALARRGWSVTTIERAIGEPPGGAGLGLDRQMLSRITGIDTTMIPVVSGNRDSAAWSLTRECLADAVRRTASAQLIESTTVTGLAGCTGTSRVAVESTAGVFGGDVVVGADGVHSVMRGFVDPQRPLARYAGYMLWRGLVAETDIPGGIGNRGQNVEMYAAPGAKLVIYGVPGSDGRTDRGHRRISYAWYDAGRTELLHETGCVEGDAVLGTLSAVQIPKDVIVQLDAFAQEHWPSPWTDCIRWALRQGHVFGTPVAEYWPRRLVRERVALVGDAAHVASPMTGAGFHNALSDVGALAATLGDIPASGVPRGLQSYEQLRLHRAQEFVASSMSWSQGYLSSLPPSRIQGP